jgi:hypothetical protein
MNDALDGFDKLRPSSRGRTFSKLAAGAALSLMIVACAAFPLVTVALPTPTRSLNQPAGPTATFTPTPVIGAVELTETPTSNPNRGTLWKGVIDSKTQRQYTNQGATVNSCTSDWTTTLYFVVQSDGKLHGTGEADLSAPASCTPHPFSGNTEKQILSLDGNADQSSIQFKISEVDFTPNPSGDFGGYASLTMEVVCKGVQRNLVIPLTGSDAANVQLSFSGDMTGCAGSTSDVMISDNQIKLNKIGDCVDLPADIKSQPQAKLCGGQ